MSFNMFESCQNCPYRTITPNCHNIDICEGWAVREYRKLQLKVQEDKTKEADNYIKYKAVLTRDAYTKSLKKGQNRGR